MSVPRSGRVQRYTPNEVGSALLCRRGPGWLQHGAKLIQERHSLDSVPPDEVESVLLGPEDLDLRPVPCQPLPRAVEENLTC